MSISKLRCGRLARWLPEKLAARQDDEKINLDSGQIINASLADYKIPGIRDIPPMENVLVEAEQHSGPFGAKGLGESGTFGVSPAIANAIHDAVGVRITELPITAEAVLRALRAQAGQPLEDE